MVIKRINPQSLGKVLGFLYGFMGLIAGAMFSLGSILGSMAFSKSNMNDLFAFFGIASILVMPFVYGILGFIIGVIGAGLYNFVARKVGGIEIETE